MPTPASRIPDQPRRAHPTARPGSAGVGARLAVGHYPHLMEALIVIGVLVVLIAAGGGYLMWRDRRRGVSGDDPASTAPPANPDPHGVAGNRFQHGVSDHGL